MGKKGYRCRICPKIETFEQARQMLPRRDEQQETTAMSD